MGNIKEEIKHPNFFDVEIVVDEQSKDETRDPYDIVTLYISYSSINNPNELIELGKWLIDNGNRIKREYTSKGKKRKV